MANIPDYANSIKDVDLDVIYITGAGYVDRAFKGISRDSALGWEEPVWSGELTRSEDFVMTNIGDINFGLVSRCEISYKYMNVEDYKALMKISKQRVCRVTFFNRETGKWEKNREMAFTGNELGKLYAFGKEYIGVTDVSIKLVATNRDKVDLISSSCTLTYDLTDGSGQLKSETKKWGDMVKVGDGTKDGETLTPPTGKHLSKWVTKDSQGNINGYYLPNQDITIWNNMTLYAVWE